MRMLIKVISRRAKKRGDADDVETKNGEKTLCDLRRPRATHHCLWKQVKCVKYGTSAHYRIQFLNGMCFFNHTIINLISS